MSLEIDERVLQSIEIPVKGLENVSSTVALGTGSFGSVYEVEAYGLPCIAKCIHPVLIRCEQQIQGARHDIATQKNIKILQGVSSAKQITTSEHCPVHGRGSSSQCRRMGTYHGSPLQ